MIVSGYARTISAHLPEFKKTDVITPILEAQRFLILIDPQIRSKRLLKQNEIANTHISVDQFKLKQTLVRSLTS